MFTSNLAAKTLQNGGVVVIRTDTLYGILACTENKEAVEKVYSLKQRDPQKECIVLIATAHDAPSHHAMLETYSAHAVQPTTVIIPATTEPSWVTRGGNTVAYRVISEGALHEILTMTGPLIAPSANPESLPPAATIEQAQQYFGDQVDLYVDGGEVPAIVHASQIIHIKPNGDIEHIR